MRQREVLTVHMFSVLSCYAGDIRFLFRVLLKFRNVFKDTESQSSLDRNVKEDIPTTLEVSFLKRNQQTIINNPSTKTLT